MDQAGLDVVEGEHDVVCMYRSTRDLIDTVEPAGPAWTAIDDAGPEQSRAAVKDALAPFTDATSGTIVVRAKMGQT